MNNHPRPEKLRATAFDGLAAALSPALIIGMVGSLVFFLVIAFYRGQYDARLMYILALYTAATVLVARIAIESDRARAAAFSVPLAIAALLGMMRFVTISGDLAPLSWIVNVGLLALTWYLADRITFDCTLLEEDRESLQGGLLQTIGSSVAQAAGQEHKPAELRGPSKQPIGAAPLKKAKHNPGVWVLYFALIAFPLFGVGQLVIPDERQRAIAFWCLVVYLACALALLMTTSLLGMRRYLRQRGAMMPPDITAKWLVAGGVITVLILLACMLMPLPGKQLSVAGMKFELTSPDNLQTSKFGWGNDGPDNGQAGQASQQPNGQGQQQDQPNQQVDKQPHNAQPNHAQPSDQANDQPGPGQGQAQGRDASAKGEPSQSGSGKSGSEQGKSDSQSKSDGANDPQSKQPSADSSRNSDQSRGNSDDAKSSARDGSQSGPNKQAGQNKDQPPANGKPPAGSDKGSEPGDKAQGKQPDAQRGKPDQGKADQDKQARNEPNNQANAEPKNEPQNEPKREPQNKPQNEPEDQPKQEPGNKPDSQPESKPLRAGDSLSPVSRSIASELLQTFSKLGSLFKWLMIAVLAGIVLFYVATHFQEFQRLVRDLMNFINALMGRSSGPSPVADSATPATDAEPARRPFSSFANPFAKGLKGWQGPQVVQHTFAALEAWAAQRGRVRPVDQTAEEFARTLVRSEPELDRLPLQAASMLDRVMFANWQPTREEVAELSLLWERMK